MRTQRIMLIFLFSCFAIPVIATPKLLHMNLSEAIKSKIVTMDAVNTEGGYKGKTTKLTVKNTTESILQLKVDQGIILKPDDPKYQPLVLAGEELLVVQPYKEGAVDVNTFCGNSPKSCPSTNLHYSFLQTGSDTLIKVLKFIKLHSLFDYLGQDAVWVITNNKSIGRAYDESRETISKQLIALLCTATGRGKPEYYTVGRHVEIPDEPAYVPKALKIIANFEVLLSEPKVLTLGVYDSAGKMIQPVFEAQSFPRAGHRFGVEFESADVTAGNYFILLKEGDKILKEQKVHVD
ncbi:MAG: hypothetical protein JWQ38_357 [Flavipsychrobacter sp.]|nr:hypothetical protein [Flavipsychrobacter sp.]